MLKNHNIVGHDACHAPSSTIISGLDLLGPGQETAASSDMVKIALRIMRLIKVETQLCLLVCMSY